MIYKDPKEIEFGFHYSGDYSAPSLSPGSHSRAGVWE